MNKKLSWTKEAFSRDIVITENNQVVGGMSRNVLSHDVNAYLYDVQIRFDVTGFLFHKVNIHDLKADNRIIGHIALHFGKRAELQLETGELYTWKRHNMLMREWDMIREGATDAEDQEIVNYTLVRQFLADHGDINVDDTSPGTAIVVLAGLFIRNYFQRRRRAAAGIIAVSGS
ncbi:hypothetical protein HNV11_21210 [Spirosoma taeanense]|uniref:Uncharacterized protein n=1 Tax=Spirosoma taeanense TaxID=2735870 RepID=A0A6M5YEG9_9BACT|nr:hypothetical protein [Spirosoma taeanense]QJW91720.1 hypothetical protein HNV11_21210 [Spirosoma taeanense]